MKLSFVKKLLQSPSQVTLSQRTLTDTLQDCCFRVQTTSKHGGASFMTWGFFSHCAVRPIDHIRYQDQFQTYQSEYIKILEQVVLTHAGEDMPLKCVLQPDSEPKHSIRRAAPTRLTLRRRQLDPPSRDPTENFTNAVSEEKPQKCRGSVKSKRRCEAALRHI